MTSGLFDTCGLAVRGASDRREPEAGGAANVPFVAPLAVTKVVML